MTNPIIIDNFLDKDFFEKLKTLIIKSEFPWFKRQTMVDSTTNNLGYFTHSFYNNNQAGSIYYNDYIIPILDQLNAISVIQVRANLTPSVFYIERGSAFHCDYIFESLSKTAILYLNSCNGGTEIKINNEIKSIKAEENKMLIFDSDVEHRGIVSTDADFRYIINFNYFENNPRRKNET